jgi:hypothetical protein
MKKNFIVTLVKMSLLSYISTVLFLLAERDGVRHLDEVPEFDEPKCQKGIRNAA